MSKKELITLVHDLSIEASHYPHGTEEQKDAYNEYFKVSRLLLHKYGINMGDPLYVAQWPAKALATIEKVTADE